MGIPLTISVISFEMRLVPVPIFAPPFLSLCMYFSLNQVLYSILLKEEKDYV